MKEWQIGELRSKLEHVWARDTAHCNSVEQWSENNKSVGQCAITSLLVNDLPGGFIANIRVGEVGHFFNIIDDQIVDLTREQFGDMLLSYENYEPRTRERILSFEDTKQRYEVLRNRYKEAQ